MTPNFFFFPAGCAYIVLMQLKDVGIIVCFKDKHLQMSLIAGMLHFFCVQIWDASRRGIYLYISDEGPWYDSWCWCWPELMNLFTVQNSVYPILGERY